MEITITCRSCDRTFPLVMIVDTDENPGHCPFCGVALAFQYTSTLVETATRVLALGDEFTRQLTLLSELAEGFCIQPESVMKRIAEAVAVQDSTHERPFEPAWPPTPA